MRTTKTVPESIYFLWRSTQRLARRLAEAAEAPAHYADPIDHPALAAMDLRQLADLPLRPPLRADRARSPAAVRPPARAA